MRPKIDLLTILTANLSPMRDFYQNVLGFKVQSDGDAFVELENEGVRFALCTLREMENVTGAPDYLTPALGQRLELAFRCDDEAEVESVYTSVIAQGAKPIKGPSRMPWGQYTAFFADPDGNIHELFSDAVTS